jgi:hypothetical protein
MPDHMRGFHEWLSRILAGGAAGCAVLLVADAVFITPFWQPVHKSDHDSWERVFWIAKFGMPTALAVGALPGLAWRWSRPFRLRPTGLIGCLPVALVSVSLWPVVARTQTGGRGPLYEVVPDTMAAGFALGALAIAASAGLWGLGQRLRSQPPGGERAAKAPDAEPGAAPGIATRHDDSPPRKKATSLSCLGRRPFTGQLRFRFKPGLSQDACFPSLSMRTTAGGCPKRKDLQ